MEPRKPYVVTVLENKSRRKALGISQRDLARELGLPLYIVVEFETRDDMFVEDWTEIGLRINDFLSDRMCKCDTITHRKLRIKELANCIDETTDPERIQYFSGHLMTELGFLNMNLTSYDRGKGCH